MNEKKALQDHYILDNNYSLTGQVTLVVHFSVLNFENHTPTLFINSKLWFGVFWRGVSHLDRDDDFEVYKTTNAQNTK